MVLLTWLSVALAHDELLLNQSLWVHWAVPLLLFSILVHVLVGAPVEFGSGISHLFSFPLCLKHQTVSKLATFVICVICLRRMRLENLPFGSLLSR